MTRKPSCECGMCDSCKRREYQREYYQANRAHSVEYQREYNLRHKTKPPATRDLEAPRPKMATPSLHRLQRLPIGPRWEREFEKLVSGL